MSFETTFTIDQRTFRLDERGGRLVNVANPTESIQLQVLEGFLTHLGLAKGIAVQQQCIEVANRIDQALRRPIGSTSKTLLAAFNDRSATPPDPRRIVRRRDRDR